MAPINWNQFSKRELVQILEEMQEQVWLVEPLDTERTDLGFKDCTCDISSLPMSEALRSVRDQATRRKKRSHPLTRLLKRPGAKRRSAAG